LTAFFRAAVDLYLSGDAPRGCMVMCTMPVEAVDDLHVRENLARIIAVLDAMFAERFRLASTQGDLRGSATVAARGAMAAALLQSIALRARAGRSVDAR
jgi:hypothetical protein